MADQKKANIIQSNRALFSCSSIIFFSWRELICVQEQTVHFSAPWMESYVFVFLQFMILLVHVYASHSILNEEEEGELEERGWPFDFDNIKKWSKLKIICSMKYSYEMHSLRDLYDCWASAIGFSIWKSAWFRANVQHVRIVFVCVGFLFNSIQLNSQSDWSSLHSKWV